MAVPAAIHDGLDVHNLHFVDVEGLRTRYYADGAGEPLVLLHGGQYSSYYSLDSWSLNLPALAERFHVHALDKLGQGYTDNPPTEQDYTFDALLRHTVGWLRALGLGAAHLVGHSRGGLLIARVAQEHPDLVRTLTVVDSDSLAPPDPTHQSGVFYNRLDEQTPKGALAAAERQLRVLQTDDPVARAHLLAPYDDEPETKDERRAVAEANAELQAGRVLSMDEIKREFGV
jgi:pimeloyl-ACP methyl ester carboxylesterase